MGAGGFAPMPGGFDSRLPLKVNNMAHDKDTAKLINEIRELREDYRKLARDLREATILAAEVAALKRAQHVYNKVASCVPTK